MSFNRIVLSWLRSVIFPIFCLLILSVQGLQAATPGDGSPSEADLEAVEQISQVFEIFVRAHLDRFRASGGNLNDFRAIAVSFTEIAQSESRALSFETFFSQFMTSAAAKVESLPSEPGTLPKNRIVRSVDELFENMMLRELTESRSETEAHIANLNISLALHSAMVRLREMGNDEAPAAEQGALAAILERVRALEALEVSEISEARLRSLVLSLLQAIRIASSNNANPETGAGLQILLRILNERAAEITFDAELKDAVDQIVEPIAIRTSGDVEEIAEEIVAQVGRAHRKFRRLQGSPPAPAPPAAEAPLPAPPPDPEPSRASRDSSAPGFANEDARLDWVIGELLALDNAALRPFYDAAISKSYSKFSIVTILLEQIARLNEATTKGNRQHPADPKSLHSFSDALFDELMTSFKRVLKEGSVFYKKQVRTFLSQLFKGQVGFEDYLKRHSAEAQDLVDLLTTAKDAADQAAMGSDIYQRLQASYAKLIDLINRAAQPPEKTPKSGGDQGGGVGNGGESGPAKKTSPPSRGRSPAVPPDLIEDPTSSQEPEIPGASDDLTALSAEDLAKRLFDVLTLYFDVLNDYSNRTAYESGRVVLEKSETLTDYLGNLLGELSRRNEEAYLIAHETALPRLAKALLAILENYNDSGAETEILLSALKLFEKIVVFRGPELVYDEGTSFIERVTHALRRHFKHSNADVQRIVGKIDAIFEWIPEVRAQRKAKGKAFIMMRPGVPIEVRRGAIEGLKQVKVELQELGTSLITLSSFLKSEGDAEGVTLVDEVLSHLTAPEPAKVEGAGARGSVNPGRTEVGPAGTGTSESEMPTSESDRGTKRAASPSAAATPAVPPPTARVERGGGTEEPETRVSPAGPGRPCALALSPGETP